MLEDFILPFYFLFSGSSAPTLVLLLCVFVCCFFCLVVLPTFPSVSSFLKLCASVLIFFVWLLLDLWKRKFHMYSSPFSFECIWPPSPLANLEFTTFPFMFLLSQIVSIYCVSLLVILLIVFCPFVLCFG